MVQHLKLAVVVREGLLAAGTFAETHQDNGNLPGKLEENHSHKSQ
jgi:hypothetical protein